MIGLDSTVKAVDGVEWTDAEGEVIFLDVQRGLFFGLDEVASRMWSELALGLTPREVAARLVTEYDADQATLEGDCRQLIEGLETRGLVTVSGSAAGRQGAGHAP